MTGGSKGTGVPHVGSRGSLGLSGGSASQLLISFLAKTLCLCFAVFLATGVKLPHVLMEVVYGAVSTPYFVAHSVPSLYCFNGMCLVCIVCIHRYTSLMRVGS